MNQIERIVDEFKKLNEREEIVGPVTMTFSRTDRNPDDNIDWLRSTLTNYRNEVLSEQNPMGVSQWKEYGQKFGYWKYFEDEARNAVLDEVIENLPKEIEKKEQWRIKIEDNREWGYGVPVIYKEVADLQDNAMVIAHNHYRSQAIEKIESLKIKG